MLKRKHLTILFFTLSLFTILGLTATLGAMVVTDGTYVIQGMIESSFVVLLPIIVVVFTIQCLEIYILLWADVKKFLKKNRVL